jgi:hypothetical protein
MEFGQDLCTIPIISIDSFVTFVCGSIHMLSTLTVPPASQATSSWTLKDRGEALTRMTDDILIFFSNTSNPPAFHVDLTLKVLQKALKAFPDMSKQKMISPCFLHFSRLFFLFIHIMQRHAHSYPLDDTLLQAGFTQLHAKLPEKLRESIFEQVPIWLTDFNLFPSPAFQTLMENSL